MKLLSLLPAMTALLILSIHVQAQNANAKEKNKTGVNGTMAMDLPYKAYYSSHFEMGNQHYGAMVLNAWKDYDNNTWSDLGDMLADTVTAVLADGTIVKGKDNFLNAIKAYRGSFSAVQSEVAAWLTVNSTDQKKQTVCIWGDETDTKGDGTKQSTALHELWFFNKDGKVDLFRQFTEQMPHQ